MKGLEKLERILNELENELSVLEQLESQLTPGSTDYVCCQGRIRAKKYAIILFERQVSKARVKARSKVKTTGYEGLGD